MCFTQALPGVLCMPKSGRIILFEYSNSSSSVGVFALDPIQKFQVLSKLGE